MVNVSQMIDDKASVMVENERLRQFVDEFEACFVCAPIMSDDEVYKAIGDFLDRAGKLLRP